MKLGLLMLGLSGMLAATSVLKVDSATLRLPSSQSAADRLLMARESGEVAQGVAEKAKSAVVNIRTSGGNGSGFIVSSDGLIITNAHVLADDDGNPVQSPVTVVFEDGRQVSGDIVGFDKTGQDLAAVRIYSREEFPALRLADSVNMGSRAFAMGYPLGRPLSITEGIVSSFDPNRGFLQMDTAIIYGNSGGPLLNANAQVVGVNVEGFLNPVTATRIPILEEIEENGKKTLVLRGYDLYQDIVGGINYAVVLEDLKSFISRIQQNDVATRRVSRTAGPTVARLNLSGQQIQANLTDGDFGGEGKHTDVYAFDGRAGQQIVVEMNSRAVDAWLELQQPTGRDENEDGKEDLDVIAFHDDIEPGKNSNAKLVARLPADGRYYIFAMSFAGQGDYTLKASLPSRPVAVVPQPQNYQFFCGAAYDPVGQRSIPATLVWNPGQQQKIPMILWKSEFLLTENITTEERCQQASAKIQKAYEDGKLENMVAGTWEGKPAICIAQAANAGCGNDYLFLLKPSSEPAAIVPRMMVNAALSLSAGPIVQSRNGENGFAVDMNLYLSQLDPEPK